jgi:hypothetical protein
LHVPSGTYLTVRGSAGLIISLLAEHGDADEAAAELARTFDIPLEQAAADVSSVVGAIGSLRKAKGRPLRRPTFRGTRTVLREWQSLSMPLKWATVKMTLLTAVVEIGLRVSDVRTVSVWLRVPLSVLRSTPATAKAGEFSGLSYRERNLWVAVNWVLARWLLPGTCLRRALLTGFCLRRRHPSLHLGIVADGGSAHAWIEADGLTYDMGEISETFGVIS